MKEPDFLKEKKRLKKAGYILMAAAVAGIVAGSKTGVWILLFVILADYEYISGTTHTFMWNLRKVNGGIRLLNYRF